MANVPVDPLQALSAALAVPPDSKEQAVLLATLRESLEAHPSPIPILCTTLIKTVSGAGDSLLKRWVLDLLHYAICRSSLSLDARTQLASQSVDTLVTLFNDANASTVKVVIQCMTTVYPLLFRMLYTNRNARQLWDILAQAKARIFEYIWTPNANIGIKISAIKFMQRVILVQTRADMTTVALRAVAFHILQLQNKNDPNISSVPADHPFMHAPTLEAEGMKLLENVITILYTSQNMEMLSAILNSWAQLIKLRPALVQLVVSSLASWTPAALAGLPASFVKSIERSLRILLIHISRGPHGSAYQGQIGEALSQQAARMERASAEEKARKAATAAAAAETSRKRQSSSTPAEEPSDAKRIKLEQDSALNTSTAFLADFDFTALPVALITELIVANLQAFSEPTLLALVQAYRQSQGSRESAGVAPEPAPAPEPVPAETARVTKSDSVEPAPPVKEEPVDPLQMDIDDDEMEYEPDRLNLELSGDDVVMDDVAASAEAKEASITDLQLIDFKLPPPRELNDDERDTLLRNSVVRIWDEAEELKGLEGPAHSSADLSPTDMWMLLVVRMITRVVDPGKEDMDREEDTKEDGVKQQVIDFYIRQDRLRQTLCDYVMADFPARLRLAITWMNEEWYNDRLRLLQDINWRPNYETWLNQVVAVYQTAPDGRDRAFSRFLLDLPAVPPDVLSLLRDLCVDPEKHEMQVGFTSLREFVVQRPSLRSDALNILLELTTHSEKVTRGAAIITVKRWVPDVQPMDGMIREFALQMLRRLEKRAKPEQKPVEDHANGATPEDNMEDGQLPPEKPKDLVQTPYLPEELELPAQRSHVLQHVELLFALSVKVPEFLDEIFGAYAQMDASVQEAIQQLITALIKSLGSSHGKLLTLMRTCPPGSESLALRVLTIFTEHGRPSAQLVALVKALISERDLDARFLIPIIAEMDKPDIIRHLPRIVSILNGQPEPKNLVRSVFSSVVTTPPQTFGSVTSNLPRVRQSELFTPAELMVLLHDSEKEIGLKSAIEAIGICFSMTDVFRSEILAVVMQQIVDEPVLPVLFLRTVIQAVTTYKSLVGFVSTTLLSRLITKKIWMNPHLWDGFILCAKVIAPASFGALLQLPTEQLRELVNKQPSLKSGLRDYVTKKPGNKARVAVLLDIFGDDDGSSTPTPPAPLDLPGLASTPPQTVS